MNSAATNSYKFRPLTVIAISVCALAFCGCNGTAPRGDLEAFHSVLRGKATSKQRILFFERTSYDTLVQKGAYLTKYFGGRAAGIRSLQESRSVKDIIAEVAGEDEDTPRFYFLLRGIGLNETVFSGYAGKPQAAALGLIPGDLLIINPPPGHFLFREGPVRGEAKEARTD
jgi:hypothetical protein